MYPRYLYLIRHAQAEPHFPPGDPLGPPLTSLGCEQAGRLADRLSHIPLDAIYTSPLHRASATAAILAARFPAAAVDTTILLEECIPFLPPYFKDWYQRLGSQSDHQISTVPERMRLWLNLWPRSVDFSLIERGEPRASQAFATFFKPAPDRVVREALVSHGNLLRYFVARAMGAPPETWTRLDSHNAGLSIVYIPPDAPASLVAHNDTGHLPLELRTSL